MRSLGPHNFKKSTIGSLPKIEALPAILKPMAESVGAYFFDAATIIPFPGEPDQIHLDPKDHRLLGKAVAEEVKKLLY
jgi:lysophospholipase L1-like esterase